MDAPPPLAPEPLAQLRPGEQLQLERCPHCRVHLPTLEMRGKPIHTQPLDGNNVRSWYLYTCKSCGGLVVAWAWTDLDGVGPVQGILPRQDELSAEIPTTARRYLHQAQEISGNSQRVGPPGQFMMRTGQAACERYRDCLLYTSDAADE